MPPDCSFLPWAYSLDCLSTASLPPIYPMHLPPSLLRSPLHPSRPLSPPLRPSVPFSASLPVRSPARPGPATRRPPRPRLPRVGRTARVPAPRRRRRAAGAARREGQPGAGGGDGGGDDRGPRPTRPAAEGAGVQSPRRLGARRARSVGHTPAATPAAAPRALGPSPAPSEVTVDMGNGEPTSYLHYAGIPLHWSPPNSDLIGHPTYGPPHHSTCSPGHSITSNEVTLPC